MINPLRFVNVNTSPIKIGRDNSPFIKINSDNPENLSTDSKSKIVSSSRFTVSNDFEKHIPSFPKITFSNDTTNKMEPKKLFNFKNEKKFSFKNEGDEDFVEDDFNDENMKSFKEVNIRDSAEESKEAAEEYKKFEAHIQEASKEEEKEEVDNIFHNTEENISITKNVIVHNVANVVEEENQFINPLSKDIIKGKVNQTVSSLSGLINNIENNPENIEIINKIKNDVVSLLNKKLKETETTMQTRNPKSWLRKKQRNRLH